MSKSLYVLIAISGILFVSAATGWAETINREGFYACQTEAQLDSLVGSINEKQYEKVFYDLMASGQCVSLKQGTTVQVVEPGKNKIKITLDSAPQPMWTLSDAVAGGK